MDETDTPAENNTHDEKEAANNNAETNDTKVNFIYDKA